MSTITTAAGTTFETIVDNAPTGLVGTINVRIEDGQNNIVFGPSAANIVESGIGIYTATLTAPGVGGSYLVIWNDGTAGPEAADTLLVAASVTAGYSTPDLLRTELGVDDAVLTDEAAVVIIEDASDYVDDALGIRPVVPATGRKVVFSEVEAWQWTKLQRATTKLAAAIWRKPSLLTDQQWDKVTGPDFSFQGRIGSRFGTSIDMLLDQSGLRRLTTTIGDRRQYPGWDSFATNHDPDSNDRSVRTYGTDEYRG